MKSLGNTCKNEGLYQVIYHSCATFRPDVEGSSGAAILKPLLVAARRRNRHLGLTGALLYGGNRFAQVLEGPKQAVESVMRSIHNDGRHAGIQILGSSVRFEGRAFDNWAMAGLVPTDDVAMPLFHSLDTKPRHVGGSMLLALLKHMLHPTTAPGTPSATDVRPARVVNGLELNTVH